MRTKSMTMKTILAALLTIVLIGTMAGIAEPSYAAGRKANITIADYQGLETDAKFEFKLYKVGHYDGPRIVVEKEYGDNIDVNIPESDPDRAEKLLAMASTVAEKIDKDADPDAGPLSAGAGDTISFDVDENSLYVLVGNTIQSNGYNWTPQPVFIDILNYDKQFSFEGDVKIVKDPIVNDHVVRKEWNPAYNEIDENFRLPSIDVKIKYNGEEVDTQTLDPDNSWAYAWKSTEVPGDEEGKVNVEYIDKDGNVLDTLTNVDPGRWTTEEDLSNVDPKIAARYIVANVNSIITNTYSTTSLKLTKKLDGFVDTGEAGNVTMAFKIVGTRGDDETEVYSNYVGLTFTKNGEYSQTVTVDNIPKSADKITVTEVYSGNYTSDATEGVTATYNEEEGIWEVEIDNTHGGHQPGSGVVNKFEKNKYVEKSQKAE